MKKRILIPYLLLTVAVLMAGFFFFRSNKLKNELDENVAERERIQEERQDYQKLLSIDTMLVDGNLNKALRAYEQELANNAENDGLGIELRMAMTRKLIALRRGQTAEALAKKDSLDSIQAARKATPFEVRSYDSLSFALEKAKVQIASMRRQLREKSFGVYTTFKSKKGDLMHYVGEVKNKMANGYGIALLETGSRYEGQWQNNERHGEGSFYWSDGEYYMGAYEGDKRNGQGTYFWPNGEKYVGQWKDDKRNGKGIFYGKDGEIVTSGIWKDDKLVEEAGKEKG